MIFNNGSNVEEMKQFYVDNGYVMIRNRDQGFCEEMVEEQFKEIIQKQPFEEVLKLRNKDGRVLCIENPEDRKAMLDILMSPLSPKLRKEFESKWTLHRGFGACCDPSVWHLKTVWDLRQDPKLYELASCILGRDDLWTDVNRPINKLPGQGLSELLHWDENVFEDAPDGDEIIQAKFMATDGTLVIVPRTHTKEFRERFKEQYSQFFPNKKKIVKTQIDPKNDPMGLFDQKMVITVPAGVTVFWSSKLLHGQEKSDLKSCTNWGTYLGYMTAGTRAQLADRLGSFREGRAPEFYPSGDRVLHRTKRATNFPKIMGYYIKNIAKGHPTLITNVTKNGKEFADVIPVIDENYVSPELTPLGYFLLGTTEEAEAIARAKAEVAAMNKVWIESSGTNETTTRCQKSKIQQSQDEPEPKRQYIHIY